MKTALVLALVLAVSTARPQGHGGGATATAGGGAFGDIGGLQLAQTLGFASSQKVGHLGQVIGIDQAHAISNQAVVPGIHGFNQGFNGGIHGFNG